MKEVRKTKGLKTQLQKSLGDAEATKVKLRLINQEYQTKLNAIAELKAQIEKLESVKEPRVSEHAIVRYFERVKGYNIQEIENEILSEEVLNLVDTLGGSGGFPNKDYQVVMKDYTVITIVNK
jgi:hypothetical protein